MLENSSFRRIWGEKTWAMPIRDGLGILRFSQFFCTAVIAAILPLWPQLKWGQAHFKNWTYNAEKPPKEAVFLGKVVRVTGFEPAASCSQSRRATNCATPGYSVYLSGWPYSPKPMSELSARGLAPSLALSGTPAVPLWNSIGLFISGTAFGFWDLCGIEFCILKVLPTGFTSNTGCFCRREQLRNCAA